MQAWNDLIRRFMTQLVRRYGLEELATWQFVLWNEPSGVNVWSTAWEDAAGYNYLEYFFNTSAVIKSFSARLRVGGISEGVSDPAGATSQAERLLNYTRSVPG